MNEDKASKTISSYFKKITNKKTSDKMTNSGKIWKEKFEFKEIPNLSKEATSNIHSSLTINGEKTKKEKDFINFFISREFYAVHFSDSQLIDKDGYLRIYSAKHLKEKKMVSYKKTAIRDIRYLGNSDYVFLSLEVGCTPKKVTSRFGTTRYSVPFTTSRFFHCDIVLLDQFDLSPPVCKLPISKKGNMYLSRRESYSRCNIYYRGAYHFIFCLAELIVKETRILSVEDKEIILNTRDDHGINNIINNMFRPEIRVPKMLICPKGTYRTP
ncbi:hypothetical protein IRP70_004978 [Salmonella enterica]|nr:hypothetical protein [Salmonella enterica]EGM2983824.1 hypothetical protein [Salmonella enterica]EHG0769608.1 hypothetical protein [Salmonella enterica]